MVICYFSVICVLFSYMCSVANKSDVKAKSVTIFFKRRQIVNSLTPPKVEVYALTDEGFARLGIL